jgi:hypothetical protein
MWYIVLSSVIAGCVLVDAMKRQVTRPHIWAFATFLCGPIVLPLYLSRRPLQLDETRRGGPVWNILKNFAFHWSVLVLVAVVAELLVNNERDAITYGLSRLIGHGIATPAGMRVLLEVWLAPIVGSTLLGFIFRRRSIVEVGPTGPLAWWKTEEGQTPETSFIMATPAK